MEKINTDDKLDSKDDLGTLTEEEIDTVLDMADFYGITTGEAYMRFVTGNYNGIMVDDDEDEDEFED